MKTIAGGMFIVREDKTMLVCHPTNHAPNFWSIPKGKIEKDETILEGAIRETFEESNIDLNEHTLIGVLDMVNYRHKKKSLYPFVCYEPCNQGIDFKSFDVKCNSNVPEDRGSFPEMDDFKWVSFDEAEKLLHYTQVQCIPHVKEFIDSIDNSEGRLDRI